MGCCEWPHLSLHRIPADAVVAPRLRARRRQSAPPHSFPHIILPTSAAPCFPTGALSPPHRRCLTSPSHYCHLAFPTLSIKSSSTMPPLDPPRHCTCPATAACEGEGRNCRATGRSAGDGCSTARYAVQRPLPSGLGAPQSESECTDRRVGEEGLRQQLQSRGCYYYVPAKMYLHSLSIFSFTSAPA
jgi:hypothetical protein